MENFSELHKTSEMVFLAVAKTTSIFILPLFMTKIIFSNILADGKKVFEALKGVAIYFILIAGFPLILEILFSITDSFTPSYHGLNIHNEIETSSASLIPFSLDLILEVIISALYWVVYYLHVFFMLIMCSMAPVVFLTSTILGLGLGIEIFLGLLIIGSSWPVIWYGFDQVHTVLSLQQIDTFGARCLELLMTFFKGAAPVAFALTAVKSPAGKIVSKTLSVGTTVLKPTAIMTAKSFSKATSFTAGKVIEISKDRLNNFRPQKSSNALANNEHRLESIMRDKQLKGEKR